MGSSELPIDVIIEYMESLAEVYTQDVCMLLTFPSLVYKMNYVYHEEVEDKTRLISKCFTSPTIFSSATATILHMILPRF